MDAWSRRKAHFVRRMDEDLRLGRIDRDLVGLLSLINSIDCYYTTSSCSGRIQISACRLPGDKFSLITLAKWHRPVIPDEILRVIEASDEGNIWFSVQPPIFHVVCRSLRDAERLLVLIRNNGFKHSGIQGINYSRVVVEVSSTERMEVPLRLGGVDIVRPEALPSLVEAANELLLRSKKRISKLEEALRSRGL